MDLDAQACYDRINQPLAAQTCYKYRILQTFCWWFLQLLNQQEHYIILQQGISKTGYKHTGKYSHHGIGQGSTAAPIIWLLTRSTLMLAMQQWATSMTWQSPSGDTQLFQTADVYVDDATLWVKIQDIKN